MMSVDSGTAGSTSIASELSPEPPPILTRASRLTGDVKTTTTDLCNASSAGAKSPVALGQDVRTRPWVRCARVWIGETLGSLSVSKR
jgi:hypothetical protein